MRSPHRWTDRPTAKILADAAFVLLNQYEVDFVEELPDAQQTELNALADLLWHSSPDSSASIKKAAFSHAAGVMIAERLRREYRAVTD